MRFPGTFPTVKSDPWGKKKVRRRSGLWPPSGWKKLCEAARLDFANDGVRDVGRRALEVIMSLNNLWYEE